MKTSDILKNAHQILEGHINEIKDVLDLTKERKKKSMPSGKIYVIVAP